MTATFPSYAGIADNHTVIIVNIRFHEQYLMSRLNPLTAAGNLRHDRHRRRPDDGLLWGLPDLLTLYRFMVTHDPTVSVQLKLAAKRH